MHPSNSCVKCNDRAAKARSLIQQLFLGLSGVEVMSHVIPGDFLGPSDKRNGPGLETVVPGRTGPCQVQMAGNLLETNHTRFVEANPKRYTPSSGDSVVGVIAGKAFEGYKVSLQDYSAPVRLGALSFESASRKNKPTLVTGDAVYAKVCQINTDLEPEIEAFDSKTGKAAGFGQLKDGNIISVGLGYARHLFHHGHPLLDAIGRKHAFDMAIGVNGRIWVKAESIEQTLAICRWIKQGETLAPERAVKLVS